MHVLYITQNLFVKIENLNHATLFHLMMCFFVSFHQIKYLKNTSTFVLVTVRKLQEVWILLQNIAL